MVFKESRYFILVVAILALTTLACNLPFPAPPAATQIEAQPPDEGTPATTAAGATKEVPSPGGDAEEADIALQQQLARHQVDLQGIRAIEEEISGPVLVLQVTNRTDEEVLVTLPCGLILQPGDEDEQRMMVIQPSEATLPPGGEAELQPYVICIDAHRSGPSVGSAYKLGLMATGDLLKLAKCICQEDLLALEDSADMGSLFGLQMAVWMTSSGAPDLRSLFEQTGEGSGALGGLVEEDLGDSGLELEQFMDLMGEIFGTAGQEWLEKCGVQSES